MQAKAPIPLVILGATGRIGRLLLRAPGPEIAPMPQTRHSPPPPGWFHWTPGSALPAAARGAVLLHLAGPTPSGSGGDYDDHLTLARAGLAAARAAGVAHVLMASSAAVYGRPPPGSVPDEDSPCRPFTAYGAAKLEMERALCGPGVTLLRIGNVAGTDLLMRNALLATAAAPLRLERFADGRSARRAYIGPGTLAQVITTLARRAAGGLPLPEVLNIAAPGPGVEMAALLAALAAAGRPVPHDDIPAPPTALADLPLCTARLAALHPFTADDSCPAAMVQQWLQLSVPA
ncbi:NAD-dependent epimerase/dehydratase family protein [Plastorhodobacter daqingensis]|uniref:NAD-dependent epimerase/dehydratase family protein n=1 Tax=Plastorhodobacter daqingensis TaxID=1387281 RepID=A0ABW2ULH0_9RHOB